jgi:hypothetical protein
MLMMSVIAMLRQLPEDSFITTFVFTSLSKDLAAFCRVFTIIYAK